MRKLDADRVIAEIARRLAELREDRGWTQGQLAEHAEISLKYVQRIEGGTSNPTIRTLVKFASTLGVPFASLFEAPKSLQGRRPGRPRKGENS